MMAVVQGIVAERPVDPAGPVPGRELIDAWSRRRDRGAHLSGPKARRDRAAHSIGGRAPVLFVIGSVRTARGPQLTNDRADRGFDENHVVVAVSLPVLVVHANPQALARQAERPSAPARGQWRRWSNHSRI